MKTIAQLLQEPVGMPVTDLSATIQDVQGPFAGTSTKTGQPYTNYRLTLSDQTGSISATWWGPSGTPEPWTDVRVSARKGAKGGLVGATITEYNGKKGINITGDHLQLAQAPSPSQSISTPFPPPSGSQNGTQRPLNGPPTLDGCLALAAYSYRRFAKYMADDAVIGPMISTLVIAYTNGKLSFDPAEYALALTAETEEPES
jgi:hypothetical protein